MPISPSPVSPLPYEIVHYGKNDPMTYVGGVETFARNLQLIFAKVHFMTPSKRDFKQVFEQRLPVVCDNHWVTDIPGHIPAIGFQHGVAEVKQAATGNRSDARLAQRQAKAAKRRNTLWVACAEWISRTFGELYGNSAQHVVYHQVDLARFNGKLNNEGSNLILHDARTVNKGKDLVATLSAQFPEWRFEPLACKPDEVAGRMSKAAAFLHLSKYEGNSIVCNEAMAQNLPCFFTRVGLMQDPQGPTDPYIVDRALAFEKPEELRAHVSTFLDSLETRRYAPRTWVEEYASRAHAQKSWEAVMKDFQQLPWQEPQPGLVARLFKKG